jgi:Fungal specific transcription factor domain
MPVRPVTLDASNTLALRLMHHYTVSIGFNRLSVCSENSRLINSLWEVDIPSMAFTSEIVMNALLGISAWHLWAMNPQDQTSIMASRAYFGKAIKQQRIALEKNDEQELTSIFITGMVLAHHNWLLSHTNDGFHKRHLNLETLHLCNGFLALGKKLSSTWSKYKDLCVTPTNTYLHLPQYNSFTKRVIQDSRRLLEHLQKAGISQEHKEVYRQAITEVLNIYTLIANTSEDVPTKETTVVNVLHRLPSSFTSLLQQQEPMAVGILARVWASLALLKNSSTAWYIHGAGDFQVYRLAVGGIMNLIPPDWKWIMDWPLEIISMKPDPYSYVA